MNKLAYLLLIPLVAATQLPQRVATPGEAVPMRTVEGRRECSAGRLGEPGLHEPAAGAGRRGS